MESGKRDVSTLELAKLARLFHRPVSYFLEEGSEQAESNEDLLVALLRAEPRLQHDPATRQHVERFKSLWEAGAELERLLDRSSIVGPPAYPESLPRYVGEAVAQGERV